MSVTRGKKAGRSLKELIKAETGSPLTHTVIKATDSSALPPKQKHIETLVRFSFLAEINDNDLCSTLMERTRQKTWIPILKALTCFHRIFRDGSMPFIKLVANQPGPFQVTQFTDLSSAEGPSVSSFIQGYGLYLNLKSRYIIKYGFDYCHAASVGEGDKLSQMPPEKLFEHLESLLDQMASILSFTSGDTKTATFGNLCVKECTSILFKDILRYWICANNATVNILEKFFSMDVKTAKEGLRLYEKFVKLCNNTDKFVEVCKMFGCNEGKEIPTLGEAPKILLPKLREHIKSGGAKTASPSTPVQPANDDPFDPRNVSQRAPAPQLHTSPSQAFSPTAELPDLESNPDNPFL